MTMDPSQLLQMLLQGGGGPAPQPTSGLQDPSLSGLALGPQGMGFGGGESLLGGGPGGFGSGFGGGPGLDLSQLLNLLQAAPGVTGAPLTQGIGDLGQGGGFGAGGMLGQPQTASLPPVAQTGQSGLGGGQEAAQLLSLLKEGVGLGKTLSTLFPSGQPEQTPTGGATPDVLRGTAAGGVPAGLSAAEAGQLEGILGPASAGELSNLTPAQVSQLQGLLREGIPGLPGTAGLGGTLAGGTGVPAAGQIMEGLGAGALPGTAGGGLNLGGLGLNEILGGAGIASNLGFGALNLAQGNLGAGLGELLGTGAGFGIGAALAPETFGTSLLLGGLGGGLGGLFGGLFGGGGPSQDWLTFGNRLGGTIGAEQAAGTQLLQALGGTQSPGDVAQAIAQFRQAVQQGGVGGYAGQVSDPYGLADVPGATGTAHEGGLAWNPASFMNTLRQARDQALIRAGVGPWQG